MITPIQFLKNLFDLRKSIRVTVVSGPGNLPHAVQWLPEPGSYMVYPESSDLKRIIPYDLCGPVVKGEITALSKSPLRFTIENPYFGESRVTISNDKNGENIFKCKLAEGQDWVVATCEKTKISVKIARLPDTEFTKEWVITVNPFSEKPNQPVKALVDKDTSSETPLAYPKYAPAVPETKVEIAEPVQPLPEAEQPSQTSVKKRRAPRKTTKTRVT